MMSVDFEKLYAESTATSGMGEEGKSGADLESVWNETNQKPTITPEMKRQQAMAQIAEAENTLKKMPLSWVAKGAAETLRETVIVPASHFINQAAFNAPRAIVEAKGGKYLQPEITPEERGLPGFAEKTLAYGAGVLGGVYGGGKVEKGTKMLTKAITNPYLRAMASGAISGAGMGGLYTPGGKQQDLKELINLKGRAGQAAVGSFLGGSIGLAGKSVQRVIQKIKGFSPSQIMRKGEQVAKNLDDLRNAYGEPIGEVLKSDLGAKLVDETKLIESLVDIPDTVIEKMRSDPAYGVRFRSDGVPELDLRNIQKLKEGLFDMVSSKTFAEGGTIPQENLLNKTKQIRDLMVQTEGSLKEPLSVYHDFMDNIYTSANSVLRSKGKMVINKLLSTLAPGGEPRLKETFDALQSMAQGNPALFNAMKDYASRVAFEKGKSAAANQIARWALIAGAVGTAGAVGIGYGSKER
jgi:hypothetical protein